jgi:hypothetical protein
MKSGRVLLKGKLIRVFHLVLIEKALSYLFGASSIQPAPYELRQGRKAAAVVGRSGVIWVACPIFFSFQYHPKCALHEFGYSQ